MKELPKDMFSGIFATSEPAVEIKIEPDGSAKADIGFKTFCRREKDPLISKEAGRTEEGTEDVKALAGLVRELVHRIARLRQMDPSKLKWIEIKQLDGTINLSAFFQTMTPEEFEKLVNRRMPRMGVDLPGF